MGISLYLAMTAAEISACDTLPDMLAYMACHFSPYSTGLSNIPGSLPPESVLILNDRTPICGHDPKLITYLLTQALDVQQCKGLLLDFQRPGCEESAVLAKQLINEVPCPVGLSAAFAAEHSCPVFLPPPPLDDPLADYLAPWAGREVWLEAALDGTQLNLTAKGCKTSPIPFPALSGGFCDEDLCCHYQIHPHPDRAEFILYRTREDLDALLVKAESLGVTMAVGLWQELN